MASRTFLLLWVEVGAGAWRPGLRPTPGDKSIRPYRSGIKSVSSEYSCVEEYFLRIYNTPYYQLCSHQTDLIPSQYITELYQSCFLESSCIDKHSISALFIRIQIFWSQVFFLNQVIKFSNFDYELFVKLQRLENVWMFSASRIH